jgi:hypothetical protein
VSERMTPGSAHVHACRSRARLQYRHQRVSLLSTQGTRVCTADISFICHPLSAHRARRTFELPQKLYRQPFEEAHCPPPARRPWLAIRQPVTCSSTAACTALTQMHPLLRRPQVAHVHGNTCRAQGNAPARRCSRRTPAASKPPPPSPHPVQAALVSRSPAPSKLRTLASLHAALQAAGASYLPAGTLRPPPGRLQFRSPAWCMCTSPSGGGAGCAQRRVSRLISVRQAHGRLHMVTVASVPVEMMWLRTICRTRKSSCSKTSNKQGSPLAWATCGCSATSAGSGKVQTQPRADTGRPHARRGNDIMSKRVVGSHGTQNG